MVNGQCHEIVAEDDTPVLYVLQTLGTDGEPHPVARALIADQAAQCGYCMSGTVVAAVAPR